MKIADIHYPYTVLFYITTKHRDVGIVFLDRDVAMVEKNAPIDNEEANSIFYVRTHERIKILQMNGKTNENRQLFALKPLISDFIVVKQK